MFVCSRMAESRSRRVSPFVGLIGLSVLALAAPAAAQISRVGTDVSRLLNTVTRGVEVAYDPQHQVYLTVGGFGALYGVFTNTSGGVLSSFHLGVTGNPNSPFGQFPTVAYGQDVNNGTGGFLVVWHQNDTNQNFLHAVVVAYPTGVISQETVLSDSTEGGTWYGQIASIAYSNTSQKFLVVYASLAFTSIKGRIVTPAGVAQGTVLTVAAASSGGGVKDPGIAWNPATDEFGISYIGWNNSGGLAGFRRVKGSDGSASGSPSTFGSGGTFASSVDVNASNHYIMGWNKPPGSQRAEFDQNGNMVGTPQLLSTRIGTPTSLSLAFNPQSQTFLAVSEDSATVEVVALELDANGAALGNVLTATNGAKNGSFYPRTRSRSDAKQWNIAYSQDFAWITNQIIATSSSTTPSGGVQMAVDTPSANQTLLPPFAVGGWAVDSRALNDNGVDQIHVWAVPTNPQLPAWFVGICIPNGDRPDVAQIYGQHHLPSGFGVTMANLPPGQYNLVFTPHSSVTGDFAFDKAIARPINVTGSVITHIASLNWADRFANGGVGMTVAGYAVNLASQSGTGIDAVHVWALDPTNATAPVFLGAATLGLPDAAAAILGQQFANGGYSLVNGTPISPGLRYIAVFSHSVGAPSFNIARVVGVFIQ